MSIAESQVETPTPVAVEPVTAMDVPPVPGAPESGTTETPTPEPPVEGEAAVSAQPSPASYDEWLGLLEANPVLREEYDTREMELRKEAKKEGYRAYQSATQQLLDETRNTLTASHQALSELNDNLTNAVGNGDFDPAQAAKVIGAINNVTSWGGVEAILDKIGSTIGDEMFSQEFRGRLYNEAKRKSVDQSYSDQTYNADFLTRIAEGMPEDVIQAAIKNNPHLRRVIAAAEQRGSERGAKIAREAMATDAAAERNGQGNIGPDGTPGRAGSSGINNMAEADRRYVLPAGHPQKITHEEYKAYKERFK